MKILLEKTLNITEKQEKTNIVIPFDVPQNVEKLHLSFSYTPKVLMNEDKAKAKALACLRHDSECYREFKDEDIKKFLPIVNLITLSLDDPEKYRGCAHRHSPTQRHSISLESASSGFYKGEIISGEWKVNLHVHALVTDYCECKLKVEAEEVQ